MIADIVIGVVMISFMVAFIVGEIIDHRKPQGGFDETKGTYRKEED